MAAKIRVVALTEAGRHTGERLCAALEGAVLCYRPQPFTALLQQAFAAGEGLICICATGIVVRTLAPVLADKRSDPPVLVLDELGGYVVPLLSGHEGGANQLGARVAAALDAKLVLTSAAPYLEPVYCVGLGCERHCQIGQLETLLRQCLHKAGLELDAIASFNSIDLKADEVAMIELAARSDRPFHTYPVATLQQFKTQLKTPSDYVLRTVGVHAVAESAALAGAARETGQRAELVLPKQKNAVATCAIARSYPNGEMTPGVNHG